MIVDGSLEMSHSRCSWFVGSHHKGGIAFIHSWRWCKTTCRGRRRRFDLHGLDHRERRVRELRERRPTRGQHRRHDPQHQRARQRPARCACQPGRREQPPRIHWTPRTLWNNQGGRSWAQRSRAGPMVPARFPASAGRFVGTSTSSTLDAAAS